MQQSPGRCSEEVADITEGLRERESERESRMGRGGRRHEQRMRRRVMGGKQA